MENKDYDDDDDDESQKTHASIWPNDECCMMETLDVYHKNLIANVKFFYMTTNSK